MAKNPITISELIHDCMTIIFRNFTLNELEDLRRVNKQFEEISIRCWKLKTKQWKRLSYYGGKKEEFNWHVTNLFDLMEELDVDYLSVDEFKLLSNYQFPNTVGLKTIIDYNSKPEMPDLSNIDKIKILVSCFPNLQKLLIYGNDMDINQILTLKNLTELELCIRESNDGKTFRFNEIFTKLKLRKLGIGFNECNPIDYCKDDFNEIIHCTSLEEILMTGVFLNLVAPNLPQLPKLKKITCLSSNIWDLNNEPQKSDKLALFAISNDPWTRTRVKAITLIESVECFELNSIWESCARIESVEVIVVHVRYSFREIKFSSNIANLREFHFMVHNHNRLGGLTYRCLLNRNVHRIISKAPNLDILTIPWELIEYKASISRIAEIITTTQSHRTYPFQLQLAVSKPITGLLERVQNYNVKYKSILRIICLKYCAKDSPFVKLYKDWYSTSLYNFNIVLN